MRVKMLDLRLFLFTIVDGHGCVKGLCLYSGGLDVLFYFIFMAFIYTYIFVCNQ